VSTYVRLAEDIEAKVSSLYSKISNPVLANLKMSTSRDISFLEVYPPQLPDLFHGGQLVVLGRFSGKGPTAITLSGNIGKETRSFTYEVTFPEKTGDDKEFVEHLWARRKVGYLLDQILANGQKKELVEEVVILAKKYGITTPYTSYLIVPDGPAPVVTKGLPGGAGNGFFPGGSFGGGGPGVPPALRSEKPDSKEPMNVTQFVTRLEERGGVTASRGHYADAELDKAKDEKSEGGKIAKETQEKKFAYDRARELLARRDKDGVQAGKLGVDLSIQTNNLRNQSRLEQTAIRNVNGRNLVELGGVWIDEEFNAKMKLLPVKAQSDAYFRILDLQPKMREVFRLGNHLVWITPSKVALIIDSTDGKDKLNDDEITKLFVAKK
jgi:Ca-activated chloride channel family protein